MAIIDRIPPCGEVQQDNIGPLSYATKRYLPRLVIVNKLNKPFYLILPLANEANIPIKQRIAKTVNAAFSLLI